MILRQLLGVLLLACLINNSINCLNFQYKRYLKENNLEDDREAEQDFILDKYAYKFIEENSISEDNTESVLNDFLNWMSECW